jgi:hypothetical protein
LGSFRGLFGGSAWIFSCALAGFFGYPGFSVSLALTPVKMMLPPPPPDAPAPVAKPERQMAIREAVQRILLAGFCGLMLLAPEFVLKILRGNIDLALLRVELGQKLVLVRSLLVGTTELEALRNAIIGQESAGDHTLLNASGSGAMGLGQVMPENVPAWSREILGREVTTAEFLSNPSLQITIIDGKLQQYWSAALWQAHGNPDEAVRRVASWWYCGDPHKFADTAPQFWNGDRYPSIAEYTEEVLQRFQSQRFKLI